MHFPMTKNVLFDPFSAALLQYSMLTALETSRMSPRGEAKWREEWRTRKELCSAKTERARLTTKYIVTQRGQFQCFITVEICTVRATVSMRASEQSIITQPPKFLTGSRPGEKFWRLRKYQLPIALAAVILLTAAPHCENQREGMSSHCIFPR